MDIVKKYWVFVILIFAIGGGVANIKSSVAAAEKKNISQDENIKLLTKIAQSNEKLLAKMDGRIELIMMVLEIKAADSTQHRWTIMPKEQPHDSNGVPIDGGIWLSMTDEYRYGRAMKYVNSDTVMIRVEWDRRDHVK